MANIFNKNEWNKSKPYPDHQEMIDFLVNHYRYNTMNSWNRSTSYANNVKLQNIALSDENIDMEQALTFLQSDNTYNYDFAIDELFNEFKNDTGYTAGFNGRSSGYIVMYETHYDPDSEKLITYPGRSIDENLENEIDEWTIDEIKDRYALVKRFDTLCDDIRKEFIYYCKNTKMVDILLLKPNSISIGIMRDDEDESVNDIFDKPVPNKNIFVRYNSIDENYIADIPELNITNITGNTLEQCVMYAQKAILESIEKGTDKND